MTIALGWHGKKSVKQKYLRRIDGHRRADELVRGIGCLANGYDHERLSRETNIPAEILYLVDVIHEGLPVDSCLPRDKRKPAWAQRFARAVKHTSDLSLVWPKFAVWMLVNEQHGVIRFASGDAQATAAIERVAALWQRVVNGESRESLGGEFAAAEAVAVAAAWAAEAAWAARAAREAAWAARAARAAAGEAAGAAYQSFADKLIELLEDA